MGYFHNLKRGDMVEFTDEYYKNYPPKDESKIKFGICVEDEIQGKPIKLKTKDGIETPNHIHALKWGGWIPEELESVYEEMFPDTDIGEY